MKKRNKKRKRTGMFGSLCISFCFWWYVVTSFVSRLVYLAQSRLGQAWYRY
jgi:hypothetical protein